MILLVVPFYFEIRDPEREHSIICSYGKYFVLNTFCRSTTLAEAFILS